MKKTVLNNVCLLILVLGTISICNAQKKLRIGYIDMEYILENVPDYTKAQGLLEEKVQKWKVEIDKDKQDLVAMEEELEKEKPLLTKELIDERQEDIDIFKSEITQLEQKRFGSEGDMIKQSRVLITPVQDQVFNAVQDIAKKKRYDFVFDKSADVVMLYSEERFNISDQVIKSITRTQKELELEERRAKKLERSSKRNNGSSTSSRRELTPEQLKMKEEREKAREERLKKTSELKEAKAKEREERKKEWEARRKKLLEEREANRKKYLEEREAKRKAKEEERKAKEEERKTKDEENNN